MDPQFNLYILSRHTGDSACKVMADNGVLHNPVQCPASSNAGDKRRKKNCTGVGKDFVVADCSP